MAPDHGTDRRHDVLLLDFGGVCLLNPVELHAHAEHALGLPTGSLTWLGPVDPSTDPLWQQMTLDETLTEREYWAIRAAEVGRAGGREFDTRGYMNLIYSPPRPELIRPGAVRVVTAARAAGYGVSVLTNDLSAFHGPDWQNGIEFFELVDHVVDCSSTGVLKPDPKAFEWAADVIGVGLDRMLFVDDIPGNVQGGLDTGLDSLWFDISRADEAWEAVARALGVEAG